ncbi:MAG: PfkB family carbohydrate kinase [Christensenella sp.]|nr:PfkB family carbohydrate kinase [Christensenella sp.]
MINTVTLNPAMDKVIYLEAFHVNCMNRIQKVEKCMGGKGTHLAYNFSLLDVENRTYGVSFGQTGKEIIETLENAGVDTRYLWYETPESRTNYLVVDEQRNCTFMAERGTTLTTDMTEKLLDMMRESMTNGDVLVIAGDASNVEDKEVQVKLLQIAKEMGLRLYLDSSGAFMKIGIDYDPYLIKPNMEELSELVGRDITDVEGVVKALDELPEIPVVMVSMGADGWVFRYQNNIYRGQGLKVPVGNTAGCGDALLTGLIYCLEYKKDMSVEEMLRFATAISATCAMSNLTVGFDLEMALSLQGNVQIDLIR